MENETDVKMSDRDQIRYLWNEVLIDRKRIEDEDVEAANLFHVDKEEVAESTKGYKIHLLIQHRLSLLLN